MNPDVIEICNLECCGIRELNGLSDAESSKEALLSFYYNTSYIDADRFRYVIFSQALSYRCGRTPAYGEKFASYLRNLRVGSVKIATTEDVKNPNSNNFLKVWIWTVDWDALKAWANKPANAKLLKDSIYADDDVRYLDCNSIYICR